MMNVFMLSMMGQSNNSQPKKTKKSVWIVMLMIIIRLCKKSLFIYFLTWLHINLWIFIYLSIQPWHINIYNLILSNQSWPQIKQIYKHLHNNFSLNILFIVKTICHSWEWCLKASHTPLCYCCIDVAALSLWHHLLLPIVSSFLKINCPA